jgi:hypothetical protein
MKFLPDAALARGLAVVLAAALSGCVGPLAPSDVERSLDDARDRWRSQGIASYQFQVSRLCFCAPDARRPLTVVVQRGQVVSMTDAETGAPVTGDPFMPVTVDGLFAAIDDAIKRDADQIDVRYDPQLGYPLEIAIDYSQQMADEEVTYFASGLVPIR